MSGTLQLQLDVLSGPSQLLSAALSQYQDVRRNRRHINWSLVSYSHLLHDVTEKSKALAIASVTDRTNSWWMGRWWCGTTLSPFWDDMIHNQTHKTVKNGRALLAVVLELTSVMSQTESAEVILGLLHPGPGEDKAVAVAGCHGPHSLTIGDVMPALRELDTQGPNAYMADERAKFEEFVSKALGPDVPETSSALYGTYDSVEVNTALEAIKTLLESAEGSEVEITCPKGSIKLAFFINHLWGISVKIATDKGPRIARVTGNTGDRRTLSIIASSKTKISRLWTPMGNLLSTKWTHSYSHSIHSETCMEHITTILTRWQYHWGISDRDMIVFSKCLLSDLIEWQCQSAITGKVYHQDGSERLGNITYNSDGYGRKIRGFAIKDIVSDQDIVRVYTSCLGEYAVSHQDIQAMISEESNIVGSPYQKSFYHTMFQSTLGRTCHCYKHIGDKLRPVGHRGYCSADDGHSLFQFLGRTLRILTLLDLEQPEYAILSPHGSDLTQSFEAYNKPILGRVYHGQTVRHAVASLPDGRDQSKQLAWAHILHGAAFLFAGQSGGIAANADRTAGIFVDGVALVGSFCKKATLSPRDSRIHLSFGRTFFDGSQITRLECYEQNVYNVLPEDKCFGVPRPAQEVRPGLVGVDNASSTEIINLRDEIATLAMRISWKEAESTSLQEVLVSPADYLRTLAWHVFYRKCSHDAHQIAGKGTIRVSKAGVYPMVANFDEHGKQSWPAAYIPSPNLPSPKGFKGCVILSQGCLELQIALICQIGAASEVVLQKDCCLSCACQLAMEVGAKIIMCC
ncbi:hypothetical protein AUP68_16961 [Ilyonectria robusta]